MKFLGSVYYFQYCYPFWFRFTYIRYRHDPDFIVSEQFGRTTIFGPTSISSPVTLGQYRAHFSLELSTSLVTMKIVGSIFSQIIRQKSSTVEAIGPVIIQNYNYRARFLHTLCSNIGIVSLIALHIIMELNISNKMYRLWCGHTGRWWWLVLPLDKNIHLLGL